MHNFFSRKITNIASCGFPTRIHVNPDWLSLHFFKFRFCGKQLEQVSPPMEQITSEHWSHNTRTTVKRAVILGKLWYARITYGSAWHRTVCISHRCLTPQQLSRPLSRCLEIIHNCDDDDDKLWDMWPARLASLTGQSRKWECYVYLIHFVFSLFQPVATNLIRHWRVKIVAVHQSVNQVHSFIY